MKHHIRKTKLLAEFLCLFQLVHNVCGQNPWTATAAVHQISRAAGSYTTSGTVDGTLDAARFNVNWALCRHSNPDIMFVGTWSGMLRMVNIATNSVTSVVGDPSYAGSSFVAGCGTAAKFQSVGISACVYDGITDTVYLSYGSDIIRVSLETSPACASVAVTNVGSTNGMTFVGRRLYIATSASIRSIDVSTTPWTIVNEAGSGVSGQVDGCGTAATFNGNMGALDSDGTNILWLSLIHI